MGTYYSSFSKFSAIWGEVEYFEVNGRECSRSSFVDRILDPGPEVHPLPQVRMSRPDDPDEPSRPTGDRATLQ